MPHTPTTPLSSGRARARHPRTPLFSLLPSPYFLFPDGSPLHSVHALPSFPSSLLPTFFSLTVAHCIVSTHSPLFPSPFSLLKGHVAESPRGRARARHPRPPPFSLLPSPYFLFPDGSPLHSVHALPSPPSSLLPTQGPRGGIAARARSSAPSTHSPLFPPPFSLLSQDNLTRLRYIKRRNTEHSAAW